MKLSSLLLLFFLATNSALHASASSSVESLRLPPGFRIEVFAEGVTSARGLAEGPNGVVFVGSTSGEVRAIGPDGKVRTLVSGLSLPIGVDYRDGSLFTSSVDRILRYDGVTATTERLGKPREIVTGLPASRHHGGRFLRIGPDGRLYFGVGAPCNVCLAEGLTASLQSVRLDGTDLRTEAAGIRNTVGFDWHPRTNELWFTDNGRDLMGDDLPPDELNRVTKRGLNFGFPYCHGGTIADPEFRSRPCSEFERPARTLGAHVAALGMRFYEGDVLIAEHGSWNRSSKVGYRIARVKLRDGRAVSYDSFVEGWLQREGKTKKVLGRPVDLLVRPDGSVLISDDFSGRIYRVTRGKTER
jgi:glucose/arabinose dehydrogenase